MKHPLRRLAAVVAFAATVVVGLAGCSPDPGMTPRPLTGIVYAGHAYNPTVDRETFLKVLDQTVEWGTYLVVVSDESEPRELWADVIEYNQSAQLVAEDRARALGEVADAVVGTIATSPESDPLEAALRIAAAFDGQAGSRQIVVLSNLLQTHGAVNLADGSLYAEPSELVASLTASGYLMQQFAETTVVLSGVGQVVSGTAQPVPDSLSLRLLTELWTEVFAAGGAEVVRDPVRLVPIDGDLQPVTVVPFQQIPHAEGCRLRIGASAVNFGPGSGAFLDPPTAEATLNAAAAELVSGRCSGQVTVIATTSSAEGVDEQQRVARLRLETVVPILARALDVDPATIATVAAGYDERYCAPDRDASGTLLPGPAAACRQVIVGIGVEL